ncbi:MAG TPA: hypothetical protein VFX65_08795, partial [Candidatus Limnocylindrales bacterium]|nr:hypothetical protein [Candidatus Limnocylindrales bacterium]
MDRLHVILALLAAALVLGGAGTAGAPAAAAASPDAAAASPDATIPPPENDLRAEAWLDEPLWLDAPAGTNLRIGAFIWLRSADAPVHGATMRIRLHPAAGDGPPAFAYAVEDWPGHVVALVEVPEGGVGDLEITLPGTMCDDTGACGPQEAPVPVLGVGPPPGVRVSAIAVSAVEIPVAAPLAGRATTIEVSLRGRIAWPEPGFVPPDRIWLQVRVPRGDTVADVRAGLVDASAGRYEAQVTFDAAGDYLLQAAAAPDATGDDLFESGLRRITVVADPGSSTEPSDRGGGGPAGWVLPLFVVLLAVGL